MLNWVSKIQADQTQDQQIKLKKKKKKDQHTNHIPKVQN